MREKSHSGRYNCWRRLGRDLVGHQCLERTVSISDRRSPCGPPVLCAETLHPSVLPILDDDIIDKINKDFRNEILFACQKDINFEVILFSEFRNKNHFYKNMFEVILNSQIQK